MMKRRLFLVALCLVGGTLVLARPVQAQAMGSCTEFCYSVHDPNLSVWILGCIDIQSYTAFADCSTRDDECTMTSCELALYLTPNGTPWASDDCAGQTELWVASRSAEPARWDGSSSPTQIQ